ncbi:MAG: Lrp/AsnC family transcriptional regulator [Acidobacteria bacterium]|nr:Lrp/AsnC family transcriptional regulator [Acidobacteriota bacterium]
MELLHSVDPLLDEVNLELLRLLRRDLRATIAELARGVGMSAPSIRERIQRLEERGILTGFRAEVSPRALGYSISAFVRVRPMPGRLPAVAELAARMPEVTECHRVTGEDCFILRVYLRSLETLDEVLGAFLVHGQTTTSLIQSSPVPPRDLPLPGDEGRG